MEMLGKLFNSLTSRARAARIGRGRFPPRLVLMRLRRRERDDDTGTPSPSASGGVRAVAAEEATAEEAMATDQGDQATGSGLAPIARQAGATHREPMRANPTDDADLADAEGDAVGTAAVSPSAAAQPRGPGSGHGGSGTMSVDGTRARDVPLPGTRARRPEASLPRLIAVANQKGGVGKTTTTVNLGAALADLAYRVLVVDLDPQGNATTGLGIDARNFELSMYDVIMRGAAIEDCIEPTSVKNLFVAPATIDLAGVEIELVAAFNRELKVKRAVDQVADDFDFILLDCPPSLGLITVNGLAAATEVLVPIQCEYYALEGLSQLLRNVDLVATNLNDDLEVSTIVLTMYDARTRLAVEVATDVRQHFADKVCRSVIPRTVRLSEAPSFGQPITVFDPTSRGAIAYRELAQEVSNGAPKRAG